MTQSFAPTVPLGLLRLVSPALPIGGFNFSQGLEYAVDAGWVRDEATALDWIRGVMDHGLGTLDGPVLFRLHTAWVHGDIDAVRRWNDFILAARETAELRAEDRHLGQALAKILRQSGIPAAHEWTEGQRTSYLAMFALAASAWRVRAADTLCGFLWGWLENQVIAAVKLVPLGQAAGQRMIDVLLPRITDIVTPAAQMRDEDLSTGTALQGIASALHETQYSRLFRS